MKRRKTILVEDVKKMVNDILKDTDDDKYFERVGMQNILEIILMKTGNYQGFGYLNKKDMLISAEGTTVGIREQKENGSWDFENTDNTRVKYY